MGLNLSKLRWAFSFGVAFAIVMMSVAAFAGDGPVSGMIPAWMNPFRFDDPAFASKPIPMTEIGNWIDHVGENIRDDGIVAIKQPDVYSQARMTKYRKDFETEMAKELTGFQFVLSARLNRLDSATTTSTTALGASLGPKGSTTVNAPAAPPIPAFGAGASLDTSKGPFANLSVGQKEGNLGLEPTVYLDEKKRFLDHLNEIRRVSIGPDQNDSSGYGLYLVRLPASITPGEKTYQGFGADLAVTVEHEFGNSFLPSTIRNLVVNDLVDQLAPVVYEMIRNGTLKKVLVLKSRQKDLEAKLPLAEVRRDHLVRELISSEFNSSLRAKATNVRKRPDSDRKAQSLTRFLVRFPEANEGLKYNANDEMVLASVTARLEAVVQALKSILEKRPDLESFYRGTITEIESRIPQILSGDLRELYDQKLNDLLLPASDFLLNVFYAISQNDELRYVRQVKLTLYTELYNAALPDDVGMLNAVIDAGSQNDLTKQITETWVTRSSIIQQRKEIWETVSRNFPSTRNPKQTYPISPREVPDFFLRDNLFALGDDVQKAMITQTPRANDVRSYLRQSLYVAFDAMSKPVDPTSQPPILDQVLMDQILAAVRGRKFGDGSEADNSDLHKLQKVLLDNLAKSQSNLARRPIGALCWAVAIDTVLLDLALREDVQKVLSDNGHPCPELGMLRFYDPTNPQVNEIFKEYVRLKWPIITFALDPITDQQNLADSFNLKRDLQLAVAFAFATGQINFNQTNTFRRQLELAADTIALNRTVTAYAHGDNSFGFRFTPRYQNPPNQRTNVGVIASQLISGGPGPDYGIKKSKLEPGIRELTAVLLVPEFLPTVRMDASGNWFRLNDPEHLVIPTRRMLEQGRKVQELKQGLAQACNAQKYRPNDIHSLQTKIQQLDAMLPLQSKVVQLPFINTATGFELFSEGVTALVPELSGFDGVDVVPAGITAEIFVYGKFFSIHETKVIVGGIPLAATDFDIISREVLQVRIPSNAIPTTTIGDANQYYEVSVATPAGISNRLLVPLKPAAPTPVVYDVDKSSQTINVFYQWLTAPDGTHSLVPTADPGKGIKIVWNSPVAFVPKTLQATFTVTVGSQAVTLALPTDTGTASDYSVDLQLFVVSLLQQLQQTTPFPTPLPATATVSVSVQPFLPDSSAGFRVRSDAIPLPSKITLNLNYNATGTNALPLVFPVKLPPPTPPTPKGGATSLRTPQTGPEGVGQRDPNLVRTAQLPVLPGSQAGRQLLSSVPNAPGLLSVPTTLQSAGSAEAEQVNRLLTGQPLLANAPPPTLAGIQALAPKLTTAASAIPTTLPPLPGAGPASPIVVMPAPVVVVGPKEDTKAKKHWSLFHSSKLFNKQGQRNEP